jgi:hypothetical protein
MTLNAKEIATTYLEIWDEEHRKDNPDYYLLRLRFMVAVGRMIGNRKLGADETRAVKAEISKAFEQIEEIRRHRDQTKH